MVLGKLPSPPYPLYRYDVMTAQTLFRLPGADVLRSDFFRFLRGPTAESIARQEVEHHDTVREPGHQVSMRQEHVSWLLFS